MISIKSFLRPLIFLIAIIFGALILTGCSSAIKGVVQADKARKAFKSAMNVKDVVDLKRNAGELADKILNHK